MVYRFTLISDEVDDFIREIKIDSEATFHDFHEAILKAAGYKNDQLTSFFICDDDWEKEQEITLEDMGTSSDEDSYIMKETKLSDLLEDEKKIPVRVTWPAICWSGPKCCSSTRSAILRQRTQTPTGITPSRNAAPSTITTRSIMTFAWKCLK